METILNKLKEEHRQVQTLLIRIQRSRGEEQKQDLYDKMKHILVPHMEAEEQTIYAKLRTEVHDEHAAEIANDLDFAHQEIRGLLQMLDGEKINSKEWLELFEDLKENVMLHVEEEENVLFNEAREDFSREELINFSAEYEEAKSHASSH